MKRIAAGLFVGIAVLASCSSGDDGPPTAKSLATKLKDAGLCKSVRGSSVPPLAGAWECVHPSTSGASPTYVWAFKSTNRRTAQRTAYENKECRDVTDILGQASAFLGEQAPTNLGKLTRAEGPTWFAVSSKPQFVADVADELDGKVVNSTCSG